MLLMVNERCSEGGHHETVGFHIRFQKQVIAGMEFEGGWTFSSTKEGIMKRVVLGSAILFASLFFCVSGSFAFTITVDCKGGGDYLTIQDGIDAAVNGDTVMVAPCTYSGIGNHDVDFGGKEIVVVSSDGPEVTIIDAESAGRGFLFQNGETNLSVLDGFTVRNGATTGYDGGGGIYIYFASPTISNCIISGNYGNRGGGIWADYSSPTITHCTIIDNVAEDYGGGIYTINGSADINHCLIEGNSATWYSGGGIYLGYYSLYGSGPRISHCTFKDNSAYYYGGYGGGLYHYRVEPQFMTYSYVSDCIFTGNSAYHGSGAYFRESNVFIYNCLFESNGSDYPASHGGGIYLNECDDFLIHNCTLSNNFTGSGDGGINNYVSNTAILNCIIYGNGGNEISHTYYHAPTVTYSNVKGGWPGTGNIDTDPQFAEEIDYHLEEDSPCVDAGDPSILDGSQPPGLGGERSDMGAYGGTNNGEWLEAPYDLFLYPTGPTTVTVGDTVFFDALIWNSKDDPAPGNYWLSLVLPNSREVLIPPAMLNHSNPLYGTTPAHGTNTIYSELQTIRAGTYTVIGRIGIYPNVVVDEESFEVQVN